MDIENLLNIVIVFFGIVNLLKLKFNKIFVFNVNPISNPLCLLVLPLSYLFIIKNGVYLIFAFCLVNIVRHHDSYADYKKVFSLKKIFATLSTLSICWLLFLSISFLCQTLFGALPEQEIVKKIRDNGFDNKILSIFYWTVIISPILEEIFFRKIMYSTLKFYLAPLFSIIISSLIFSLVHCNLSAFPLLFSLGIALCLIFEKTKSIIYPIILHSLFNFIMIIFIINS